VVKAVRKFYKFHTNTLTNSLTGASPKRLVVLSKIIIGLKAKSFAPSSPSPVDLTSYNVQ